jgi:hypothetical protein
VALITVAALINRSALLLQIVQRPLRCHETNISSAALDVAGAAIDVAGAALDLRSL